ncbi:MAG: aspartate kinase [Gammaproteobacteria bacterium]|nr:MAG: aspartate kinase [Gammaproteobacteria bacterium]
MALVVQKYGGTSVGSIERIKAVAKKVISYKKKGYDVVVVLSAMSGQTNYLTSLAKQTNKNPKKRELDMLLSTGEQVTIALLAMAIDDLGYSAISLTGKQANILTDNSHSKARIIKIDNTTIKNHILQGKIVIIAGFQGCDKKGEITTLGRGGSDTSAVAIAASLQASECQIYTDVDGVYTADPRVVKNATKLSVITFEEMLELASLGSKVLQSRSVEFAGKYKVPLRVLSSFEEGQGTLITTEEQQTMEQPLITGIASSKDEAQLTVQGVPDQPGIASKILKPISDADIEVDMIVQSVGEKNTTDFTFTVRTDDYENAKNIISKTAKEIKAHKVYGQNNIVKVSIVGVGMRSHAGIASRAFSALAKEGINILVISTSEIKISVIIEQKYNELAQRTLHNTFELDKTKKQ